MAARRLRARSDASAPRGARRSAGRLSRHSRGRDEWEVDRDGHDRAVAPRRRAQRGCHDLPSRRELERASPHRRRGGGLRGRGSARPLGRGTAGRDAVRDRHGCRAHGIRRSARRRCRRRGRARRPLRRDERPSNPRRAPHERRARPHGGPRRHARGDRNREARRRAARRDRRSSRRHVRLPRARTRRADRRRA